MKSWQYIHDGLTAFLVLVALFAAIVWYAKRRSRNKR